MQWPCACHACAGLWPTLYCTALNYPVDADENGAARIKARAYATFFACLVALLPCDRSRGALSRAMRTIPEDARSATRESVCRFVYAAEREWWRAGKVTGMPASLPDRCTHYERTVRVPALAPTEATGPAGGPGEWFARAHCSDRGMRSVVWGPPVWLLLYALEASAERRPAAWKALWTRALGHVLPCAVCRERYARETLPEVVEPHFRRGPRGASSLVFKVHRAVRNKVARAELAPRPWLVQNLHSAALALREKVQG